MKIALDAQLFFEKEKTGISQMSCSLMQAVAEETEHEIHFQYIKNRSGRSLEGVLDSYKGAADRKVKRCSWMYNFLFWKLNRYRILPYFLCFPGKPEITQFFNYTIPYGVRGKKACFIYDMAYRAYPETLQAETLENLNRMVEGSCRRADKIITISEFSRKEIIKYLSVPPEKIEIVPCGVDLQRFHPEGGEEEKKSIKKKYHITGDYFLYIGTLEPRKNIPVLLQAYAMLQKKYADREVVPKLVLAGKQGWNYDPIFETVKSLGIEQQVIFTGYVPEEDVPGLYRGAAAFVFPSLYEGFGMPPLEAMACGTPVIVSDAASLPEVVQDAGLLFPSGDAGKLSVLLETVWKNQDGGSAYRRQRGLEIAAERTWKDAAHKLLQIYDNL